MICAAQPLDICTKGKNMSTDRIPAWLGVALALLALTPTLLDPSWQIRIAYGSVIILLFVVTALIYNSIPKAQYHTLANKFVIRILKEDGSLANISLEQRVRVNCRQLQEIWRRNITADGIIQNFLIDGQPPDIEESAGGCLSVCKHFKTPLLRGNEVTIVWTNDYLNSFTAESENFMHEVVGRTDYLELIVEFPEGRPCRSSTLHEWIPNGPAYLLPNPSSEQHGKILRAVVKRPREGHTIRLDWEW